VPQDFYLTGTPTPLLDSARALMVVDSMATFATVDGDGQPRLRTVKAFLVPVDTADPASRVTVWVMTRRNTRKLDQLRAHPEVTLYFNDDLAARYATVMGRAVIHTDPADPRIAPFLTPGWKAFYWPGFPADFVMIEIRPRWVEYTGPGFPARESDWRPQAAVLEAP
jgi:general stress protein 26